MQTRPPFLRPFWHYYGAKWRAAPLYPAPTHDTIIEPFAGAAGYSLRHYDRNVVLYDKYPVVAGIWHYLITAPPAEVACIPVDIEHVDELPSWVPQEARWLVGFWFDRVAPRPNMTRGISQAQLRKRNDGMFVGWTDRVRDRIVYQMQFIRHWTIVEGSYASAPPITATWYVDPPYQRAGHAYICSSKKIDFAHLGAWCRSRRGQVIVCEASDATWLPFKHLANIQANGGNGSNQHSSEGIWTNGETIDAQLDRILGVP